MGDKFSTSNNELCHHIHRRDLAPTVTISFLYTIEILMNIYPDLAAYRNISHLPNVASHSTVNPSVEFVDPSGTHTQNIESYWCKVKMKLKRMKGCPEDEVVGYLDEFMWRERHGNSAMTAFNICRDIATV